MLPHGRELQELLSPHRVQDFLKTHWGRKPLYIPGPANKFDDLQFDLLALESVLGDVDRRDRLDLRFVGADDKVAQTPGDLEHYSVRDGELTVCADWINDRFDSLASYCAGIKTGPAPSPTERADRSGCARRVSR